MFMHNCPSSVLLKNENHHELMSAYTMTSCMHDNRGYLSVNIAKVISPTLSGMFMLKHC